MRLISFLILKAFVPFAVAHADLPMSEKEKIRKACDKAFAFASDRSQCAYYAQQPEVVTACKSKFPFGPDQMNCITTSLDASIADACLRLNKFDSDKMNCLRTARAVKGGVDACYETFKLDTDRRNCIQYAVTGDGVRSCAAKSKAHADRFSCFAENQISLIYGK